ncbi:hypothetical protein [Streptomyces turgidiscabies]|uniref:hypothetical protein n=1 Tax=Streptomyces turgidiscabies TaxID=85558 RepID=UPI0038F80088
MSKNRARDRAAKTEMDRTGARRAQAVRAVDTTGQVSRYPVSLVDDNGERWYLQSGQTNAYGTRRLDWSESRTYEEITEQAGPVRHVGVPADGEFPSIRQALTDAGPTALSTLIAALHAAATAAETATGRPQDLVAGRPGSSESVIVLQMTLDVGPRVPRTSVDPAALAVIAPILTRWVTGETVVEVAENLAYVLGGLIDELGWHGITDPWTRRNAAPYASWATGHSNNPVGAHRARAAAQLLDETEETIASTAFPLDSSIPVEPDPALVGDSTMEQLFAALVARALHTLEHDGTEYPARGDVFSRTPPRASASSCNASGRSTVYWVCDQTRNGPNRACGLRALGGSRACRQTRNEPNSACEEPASRDSVRVTKSLHSSRWFAQRQVEGKAI